MTISLDKESVVLDAGINSVTYSVPVVTKRPRGQGECQILYSPWRMI